MRGRPACSRSFSPRIDNEPQLRKGSLEAAAPQRYLIDAGVELAPTRARLTIAAKLGIVYLLSAEAGIAIRGDANDADIGVSGRLRLNVPIGRRLYLSPYLRSSAFQSGARDSEIGLGIKLLLWGSSSKLEGVLNH